MKKIISIIAILLVLSLTLTGCFEKPAQTSGESVVPISKIKDLGEYFKDNICLGIASINNENKDATANKYCNDFEHITRYRFDNDTEYVTTFLIIPKDDSVSFDICSVKLSDEGTIEPEFEIDHDIKEPIVFSYDNYESTMPQYALRIKTNDFDDFMPLSFSGYDDSLVLNGHESIVVDLTIYDEEI